MKIPWRAAISLDAVVVIVVVTLGAWYAGWPLGYAAVIAVLGWTVFVIGRAVRHGTEPAWPVARGGTDDGRRLEFAALTWTFIGRKGEISEAAVRRLRSVAHQRLARLGIADDTDAGQARARELMGERAWAALANTGGSLPRLSDIEHCISVLERLSPDRAATPPGRTT